MDPSPELPKSSACIATGSASAGRRQSKARHLMRVPQLGRCKSNCQGLMQAQARSELPNGQRLRSRIHQGGTALGGTYQRTNILRERTGTDWKIQHLGLRLALRLTSTASNNERPQSPGGQTEKQSANKAFTA